MQNMPKTCMPKISQQTQINAELRYTNQKNNKIYKINVRKSNLKIGARIGTEKSNKPKIKL